MLGPGYYDEAEPLTAAERRQEREELLNSIPEERRETLDLLLEFRESALYKAFLEFVGGYIGGLQKRLGSRLTDLMGLLYRECDIQSISEINRMMEVFEEEVRGWRTLRHGEDDIEDSEEDDSFEDQFEE